jgi:hypothetical protein
MAHTAPAEALVLHHTKIGKGAMKKLGIYSQWRSYLYLTVIFHLSLGRASMNDFAKNLRASPLLKAFRLIPLSAGSISMDSSFKKEM